MYKEYTIWKRSRLESVSSAKTSRTTSNPAPPLAITRRGETLGFYIPAQKRSRKAELEAMRAAARDLDEMISSWGATEDKLMDEYKEIRRSAREKSRNAK